jgi:hypothetical protein
MACSSALCGLSGNGHCNLPANILALFEAQHLDAIAFDFKDLIPMRVGPEVATPQGDGYRPPGIQGT